MSEVSAQSEQIPVACVQRFETLREAAGRIGESIDGLHERQGTMLSKLHQLDTCLRGNGRPGLVEQVSDLRRRIVQLEGGEQARRRARSGWIGLILAAALAVVSGVLTAFLTR